jgi:hypothetical protein
MGAVNRHERIIYGAPTYKQCRIFWDELQRSLGGTGRQIESRLEWRFREGRITCVSLDDYDNARGYTADGLVIDEAAFVAAAAWYDVARSWISDTGGWSLVLGTPKGKNWFWREWLAAKDEPDAMSWQSPTLGCRIENGVLVREPNEIENPEFSWDELQAIFRRTPARTFEQEYLARFVEDAGAVFRNLAGACNADRRSGPEQNHSYCFGVDWAKSHDWTVVSVFDSTTRRQVTLDRFNRIDYVFQLAHLEAMVDRWKPQRIICEQNAMGEPLVEQLIRKGLPVAGFVTTNQSKTRIIEALALAIERGELALLSDEIQRAELEAFEMERLPGGTFRYSAPEGMHDDCVMALALAWEGCNTAEPNVWVI